MTNPQVRIAPSGPLAVPSYNFSGQPLQFGQHHISVGEGGQVITTESLPLRSGLSAAIARIKGVQPTSEIVTQIEFDVLLTEWDTTDVSFEFVTQVSNDEGLNWTTIHGENIVWPISAGPDPGEAPTYNSQRVRFTQSRIGGVPWNPNVISPTVICRGLIRRSSGSAPAATVVGDQGGGYVRLLEVSEIVAAP